ncbi:MAG TPA: hypothetical protein VNY74_09760 [Edaphobacter sp.]|nr:hypothetical protein [Edaphobacter sp.]
MSFRSFRSTILCIAGLILLSEPGIAAPIVAANCNASFTVCDIPENTQLMSPFLAFAGDVVLTDPGSSAVSDVFRIFNNAVNTGEGTGLGNMAFLYSSDDTSLPNPSTYSANVVFLPENPSGVTTYFGNGTNYLLAVPEPRTFELFALAAAVTAVLTRRRSRPFQGDLRCDRHS